MLNGETSNSEAKSNLTNMAGTYITLSTLFVANKMTEKRESWIVDSGATCHIISKMNRLSSISSNNSC